MVDHPEVRTEVGGEHGGIERPGRRLAPAGIRGSGELLEQGLGAQKDRVSAYLLYAQAAESYQPAAAERDRLKAALTPDELGRAESALQSGDGDGDGDGAARAPTD